MNLTTTVQEGLLSLLCFQSDSGRIVAALLEPSNFDAVYREIAEAAISFRDLHGAAPGEHTLDLFEEASDRDPEREELYRRLYHSLVETQGEINEDFVLGRARSFAKVQRYRKVAAQLVREVAKGTEAGVGRAEALMAEALRPKASDVDERPLRMFDDVDGTLEFFDKPQEVFETGLVEVDRLGLGPARKAVHLLVAPPKGGKSWWLVHLAKMAHIYGRRVLYLTLELTRQQVSKRLVQSFFALSKRDGEIEYRRFASARGDGEVWTPMRFRPKSLSSGRSYVAEKVAEQAGTAELLVSHFPEETLTIGGYERHLDVLEVREKFVPDLVCIDYPDWFALERGADSRWEALTRVYVNIRRIAVERNHAAAAVSQGKAGTKGKARVDANDTAGTYGKIGVADTIFTYSQTEAEKEHKLARIGIDAAREDEDGFTLLVSQNYAVGQFCLSSIRMTAKPQVEEEASE